MQFSRLLPALLIACALATPAHATDYLTGYVGAYDVTQSDDPSTEFGVEYRYKDIYHGLRPLVGAFGNSDGAVYGYGGIIWDIKLSDSIIIAPNFAAGAYSHGSSKDLGYWLEFRSGIEAAYQFQDQSRIGVEFNHISNADLGSDNPGTESLLVNYSYPLHWMDK